MNNRSNPNAPYPTNGSRPQQQSSQQPRRYPQEYPPQGQPPKQPSSGAAVSPMIILIKIFLLIASLAAAALFVSFLFTEFTYEYTDTITPTVSVPLSASGPTAGISEADIPVPVIAAPEEKLYDFAQPVPESPEQPMSVFDKAVFIGDSRTTGLLMYTKIDPLDFSSVGLNVSTILTKEYIRLPGENGEMKTYTLKDALEMKKDEYDVVYIAMGLNELGWEPATFIRTFKKVIETIRSVSDVPIYIQLIMPVTTEAAETSKFGVTNEKVYAFNDEFIKLAADMELFYLDPTALFAMEDGTLEPSYAFDGIHLTTAAYATLAKFYQTHIVDLSAYDNLKPAA